MQKIREITTNILKDMKTDIYVAIIHFYHTERYEYEPMEEWSIYESREVPYALKFMSSNKDEQKLRENTRKLVAHLAEVSGFSYNTV